MEDQIRQVEQLFIYPVKSMAGISVAEIELDSMGIVNDRRYMLADAVGRFLTQRERPELAMFRTAIRNGNLFISTRDGSAGDLVLPLVVKEGADCEVEIWSDRCRALEVSDEANTYFSDILKMKTKLVFMADNSARAVDLRYTTRPVHTSFTDGYPILLAGTASLDDLNNRLAESGEQPVGWDRFRPNIVVSTGAAYEEDEWKEFMIGDIQMRGVKLCSRCVVTTINQQTLERGKEPLRTLAGYRTTNNKVNFGQNVVADSAGGLIVLGNLVFPRLNESNKNQ